MSRWQLVDNQPALCFSPVGRVRHDSCSWLGRKENAMNLLLIALGIAAGPLFAWMILTSLFVLLRSLLGLAPQPVSRPAYARTSPDIAAVRI
jgi:hypothetical protein